MKIFTFLASCFLTTSALFGQCANGRYASDVYSNVTITSNIQYGANTSFSGANTNLTLDFYEPTGDTATKRPLIIWIHGGSFLGGTKNEQDVTELSNRFAKKGYACVSINYRTGFFPIDSANALKAVMRAVQDLNASIRFFYKDRATTNTYKIDTNAIYVGGSSAGAITALHSTYMQECELLDYVPALNLTALGGFEGNSGNPGYSRNVRGVINLCGALGRYSWLEPGDLPLVSLHGTADNTVKYNRGIVNPGVALLYLDGSRMLDQRSCAINQTHPFYTFRNAPHVPYLGTNAAAIAYMDTTANFVRDFLIDDLGCTDAPLQAANTPSQTANLYAVNYCDGSPVNEVCSSTAGITEEAISSVTLYPNPAKNQLFVETKNANFSEIVIMDAMGRKMLTSSINGANTAISLNGLNAGNYFVVLTGNGTRSIQKLIIE